MRRDERSRHRRNNMDSVMVCNLIRHILHQQKLICELRRKLALIYDIYNSNNFSENNVDSGTEHVDVK